jgi:hypothetical protein
MRPWVLLVASGFFLAPAGVAASPEDEAIRLATERVAADLGVARESLEVREVAEARWRDSSLGCPEKGVVYQPVLISGHRVQVASKGKLYLVHVGRGAAVRCYPPPRAARTTAARVQTTMRMYELARRHLAQRLGIAVDGIQVESIRARIFADDGLGCSAPSAEKPGKKIDGFVVVLSTKKARYRYHTDTVDRVIPCDEGEGRAGRK